LNRKTSIIDWDPNQYLSTGVSWSLIQIFAIPK
jgi:hypothetical protein